MKTNPAHTVALDANDIAEAFSTLNKRDTRERGHARLAGVLAGGRDIGRSPKARRDRAERRARRMTPAAVA